MTQSGTSVCSSFKVVGAVKEKNIWPEGFGEDRYTIRESVDERSGRTGT